MFFCYLFLVVSLMSLNDFHVSFASMSCDEQCADKPVFTPSRLVVKYGDGFSAKCLACRSTCQNSLFDLEKSVGVRKINGTTISWTVDRMTEWGTAAMCFYNDDAVDDHQCCSTLPVTVYQPPDNVSISFVGHSGPMFEGHQYTLQCAVRNVAPVENLNVTFYRGQTALGQLQSNNNTTKKPVTETFTLNITPSKEDDGVQYWCEAKLEFEVPQPPPVVTSQNVTATVYYKPQLEGPSDPDPIVIAEGAPLRLNCSAVGNPSPSYTWTLPSDELPPINSSVFTNDSVTSVHKGQYTCEVRNEVGTFTVKFNVDVQGNHIGYIIAGTIIAAALVVLLVVILYINYYKHNRMGQYKLKDVFRLRTRHTAVSTTD